MHLCVCNFVNFVMHHVWWEYGKFYSILFYYVATVLFVFTSLHLACFPHSSRAEAASKGFLCRQHQRCLFNVCFFFFPLTVEIPSLMLPDGILARTGCARRRLRHRGRWASPLIGLLKFSDTVGLWTTQTPSNIKTKSASRRGRARPLNLLRAHAWMHENTAGSLSPSIYTHAPLMFSHSPILFNPLYSTTAEGQFFKKSEEE